MKDSSMCGGGGGTPDTITILNWEFQIPLSIHTPLKNIKPRQKKSVKFTIKVTVILHEICLVPEEPVGRRASVSDVVEENLQLVVIVKVGSDYSPNW